jgi:two-component system, NarL family, nitrate/nitrite response regulator NarL
MQVAAKASSTTMAAVVSPSVPGAPQPSIRVLLVDDHPTVLWGLEKLIDSAKPTMEVVGTATNRADALAAAAQHQPDVVLVDIDLGGDCGLDLLQELSRQCHAKPIVFTGMRDSELGERAVLHGARGLVHKMDPADVILKAIEFVHRGELWLDRAATAKVFEALRTGGEQQQTDATPSGIAALTQKEREVVVAVIEHKGAPSKVIAAALHISPYTLRNHLSTIYSKLDVRNRMDLLMYAHEHGLHQVLS